MIFTACKDKPPTKPSEPMPNISGTWQGTGTKSGITYYISVTLTQAIDDTTITGQGVIDALLVKIPFTITGANQYPNVRMTFTNPDPNFGTGSYLGAFDVSNNVINGVATVPAFAIVNEPLKIERQ